MKLELETCVLDLDRHAVIRDGAVQRLSTTERNMLAYLASRPGEAVSRSELLRAVWGHEVDTVTRAVDVAVTRARSKIERDPAHPTHLITVHGQGYRWVPLAAESEPAAHAELAPSWIEIGPHRVDLRGLTIQSPEGAQTLTGNEGLLLARLDQQRGEPVSREALIQAAWGVHGADGRALDHAIRRLRAKLERDPRSPAWLQTLRGIGFRLVASVRTTPPAPPSPSTELIGRGREIDLIRSAWAEGARVVTLHGPGGVGKSRIATELARLSPDPVWSCDLTSVRTQEGVAGAVATLLVLPPPDRGTSRTEQLGYALAAMGPCTLVLDNADRSVESLSALLPSWMDQAPTCRFVVTTRHALGLPAEHVIPVDPLLPGDAVALFRLYAKRMRLELSPQDDPVLEEIVSLADGLPLAIELATSRLQALSLPELRDRLKAPLRFLRGPRNRDALARTLETSWSLLDEDLRQAYAVASWLAGGFDLSAFSALLGADALERAEGLLAYAILRRVPSTDREGPARFAMLDTVRTFGLARLLESPDVGSIQERHVAHYRAAAEAWADAHRQTGSPGIVQTLEAERTNLSLALEHASDLGTRVALARAIAILFALRGAGAEDHALLDRLVDDASEDPVLLLRALSIRAHVRGVSAVDDAIVADLRRILSLARPEDPMSLDARTLLARVLLRRRDPEARRVADEGIQLARQAQDRVALAMLLSAMGLVLNAVGAAEESHASLTEALVLAREAGNAQLEALTLNRLTFVYMKRNEIDLAMQIQSESIRMHLALGDRLAVASLTTGLGMLREQAGASPQECIDLHVEAARIARVAGAPYAEAVTLLNAGLVEIGACRHLEAEAHLKTALQMFERLELPIRVAATWALLGQLYQDRGWTKEARTALDHARESPQPRTPHEQAALWMTLGTFELEHGAPSEAARMIEEARALFAGLGAHRPVHSADLLLALARALEGDPAGALALWKRGVIPRSPPRRAGFEVAVRAHIHLAQALESKQAAVRSRELRKAADLVESLRVPTKDGPLLSQSEDARIAVRIYTRIVDAMP